MPGLFDNQSGGGGGILQGLGNYLQNVFSTPASQEAQFRRQGAQTIDQQLGPGMGALLMGNPAAGQQLFAQRNLQLTHDALVGQPGPDGKPINDQMAWTLALHPDIISEQGKPINVPPGGSVYTPLFGGGQGGAPNSQQQQPPSSQPVGGAAQGTAAPGAQFTNRQGEIPEDQADLAAEQYIVSGGKIGLPAGYGANSPFAWQNRNIVMGKVIQKMQERNIDWRGIASNGMKYEGLQKNMGDIQKTNNALNTGIGHLAQLGEVFQNLGNQSFQPSNYVKNVVGEIFGSAAPTNYKAVAARVAPEITRIWRGAGGAEADIHRDLQTLSDANSPEQGFGAISNIAKLMSSKLDANKYQFESVFGPGTAKFMMSPDSQAGLAKLQQQGATTGAPGAMPQLGEVRKGHKFLGGNPADPKSWQKIQQQL